MSSRRLHPATLTALLVYLATGFFMLLEQWGRITTDNRPELSLDPAKFWWANFTLWHPEASFGEVHNQLYGYMFPQGIFFIGLDWLGLSPWVVERLWSLLVVVAAAEGCRRVARAIGLDPWSALVAGLAFGFNVRLLAEVGVRSAEILPSAVLPWVVLPIVHALNGRLRPRTAAIWSAAAFACGGAANATATIAGLPLVAVLVVWGLRTRRCGWSLPLWWAAVMAVTNAWWVVGLLTLGKYSAPFFDYVEDARTATSFAGPNASLRGASNWVNLITVGDHAWWPAGLEFATAPWLIAVTGVIAAAGLLGLVTLRSPYRTPMAWAAALGFVCLTVGIAASGGSPVAAEVRSLLDGPLVALRNIHKVDGVFRLPLALGLGALVAAVARWWQQRADQAVRRDRSAPIAVLACTLVLVGASPVWAGDLRTPGFTGLPTYWQEAADYLDDHADGGRTWVITGAGFGLQTWGWSIEEPLGLLTDTPWVSRSQVPLVPSGTIRMLSALETLIETGAGSPRLGEVLSRVGISHVLVRHDLDPTVSDSTSSALVSTAMARSGGVHRTAAFGPTDVGVEIEIFDVTAPQAPALQVRSLADAKTVASSAGDVVTAVSQGLLAEDHPALVRGDNGWDAPADLVGDAYRLRERTFGRVHDAYSSMMTAGQEFRLERRVTDYPGPPGARPAVLRYDGIEQVSASSSLGYADNFGAIHPENGPFAALDGDPATSWRSGYYRDPEQQWLRVDFGQPRVLHDVAISTPVIDQGVDNPTAVEFVAGDTSVAARVDSHGHATADLGGVTSDSLLVRIVAVAVPGSPQPVAISEVQIGGITPSRTLVLAEVPTAADVDWLFTATPETRTCEQTLFAPDCQLGRFRPGEESSGLDRTITVDRAGRWSLSGSVVVRSDLASMVLTQPLYGVQVKGSSVLTDDPAVSWRMADDGLAATSWIADYGDPSPTLTITWPKPVRIDRIQIAPPPAPAVPPTQAVLRSGDRRRIVDLTGFGTFSAFRTREVTIEFSHPGVTGQPIGMAEVTLGPGSAVNPLDGNNPTGAFCGFGPPIVIDGKRYETQVDGLMGDVISAGAMSLKPCRDDHVSLSPGEHRIQVLRTDQFQPVALSLTQDQPETTDAGARSLRIDSRTDDRVVGQLGSGADAVLSTDWNLNPGWVATVDGTPLKVQIVDGWAQGWLVPSGLSGRVVIEFAPQQRYAVGLAVGLVLLGLVVLLALVLLLFTRLAPATAPVSRRRSPGRLTQALSYAVLVLLAGLGGGVPFAAGALVGLVALRFRRAWPWLAAALAVATVTVATVAANDIDVVMPRWVDVVTLVFVAVVLTRLLTTPPPEAE